MSEAQFDVIFIGGGPGGYVGAIRAAQLGMKTAVIEKRGALGGTCLNVGCIPSKALLESSEHFAFAQHDIADHGIEVSGVKLDLEKMMARKRKIVSDLTGGIEYIFKKNSITYFKGTGAIRAPGQVTVNLNEGGSLELQCKSIVIATGSVPNSLPGVNFDGTHIISSTEALELNRVPKHLIVIGAGYIGLEMGSVWLRLGAEVTVLEYANGICGTMDQGVAKRLQQILKKQGMKFELGVKVLGAQVSKGQVVVNFENRKDQSQHQIIGDMVLVSAGRKPYTEGLGLDKVGVKVDQRGVIEVDDHFQTNVPGIYAVGDTIRGPMLAHKAEEEGVALAEILAGQAGHVNYETVPGVIYTWPEVASVGATEEQLKEQGIEYRSGTFPFSANGRAKALGFTEGQAKVLADAKTDRILGVHIIGPRASEMISEAVVAMEFGGSSEDLARSFHAHPTLSEVLREAALAVDKRARQS